MRGVNAVAPNPAEAANTSSHVLAPTRQAPPGCRVEKSCGHINRGCICVGFLCLCGRYHRAHRGGVEWVITEAKEEERKKGCQNKKTNSNKNTQNRPSANSCYWTRQSALSRRRKLPTREKRATTGGEKKRQDALQFFSRVGFGL